MRPSFCCFPSQSRERQLPGGLDCAGHMQEREEWPAGTGWNVPAPPSACCFPVPRLSEVRFLDVLRACAPGSLCGRMLWWGFCSPGWLSRGRERRRVRAEEESDGDLPPQGLPASLPRAHGPLRDSHQDRHTERAKGAPRTGSQGGVRPCGMGSEHLPGTCPAAP